LLLVEQLVDGPAPRLLPALRIRLKQHLSKLQRPS
jgi:hypothetical protein